MAEKTPPKTPFKSPGAITAKNRWAAIASALEVEPLPENKSAEIVSNVRLSLTPDAHSKFRRPTFPRISETEELKSEDIESTPTLPPSQQPRSEDESTAAQKPPQTEDAEKIAHLNKKFKALKFIARISAAANKKKAEYIDEEPDFEPESVRHFLFDDTALRRGGPINELFQVEEVPEEDFNEIVDQDDTRIEVFVSVELVGKLLESVHFKFFIFALIVINSALIGLQTDAWLSVEYRFLFSIFDHAVLAIFVCEILLKWYHGFWIFWQVGWNILDFVIIVALLLGPQLSFLSSSRILRILRVLRAFRSLRSISALAGLSMVVQTILQSIPDMANICLLLTIILLMLAVAGCFLFGKNVPEKFGDLQTSLFSLFICVTQDGWVNIYNRFKSSDNLMLYIGGSAYFVIAIVIGAFVFANLIVAVVVTNLELAMKELKVEKRAQVDTMATNVEQDMDDPVTAENTDTVPLVPFHDLQKGIEFSNQAPLQLMDLRNLSLEKLEKYFVVISAIEDNLAEYINIKADLIKMYEVVRRVNTMECESGEELIQHPTPNYKSLAAYTAGAQAPSQVISGFNLNALKKGDILSNIMMMQETMGQKTKANTFTDVLKKTKSFLRNEGDRRRGRQGSATGRKPTKSDSSDEN